MLRLCFASLLVFMAACSKPAPSQKAPEPPSVPCNILIVRHGETEWNADGKGQGWNDIPLNDYGREQAREMAEEFEFLPIKTVYTSSLSRAVETAQIIAAPHAANIIPDPAIRFYRRKTTKTFWPFTEKGKAAVIEREIIEDSTPYLMNIAKNHPGETVIFVTHRRVVGAIHNALSDGKTKAKKLANGKVLSVRATPYSLALQDFEVRVEP